MYTSMYVRTHTRTHTHVHTYMCVCWCDDTAFRNLFPSLYVLAVNRDAQSLMILNNCQASHFCL